MKNKKLLSLVVSALTLASVVGCGGGKGGDNVITIWVGAESVQFYSQKVEEYKEYYAQQKGETFPCTFSVKGVDTGTAADVWLSDPEVGADIFTIAHDNIAKLVDGDCPIMPVTDQSLLAQVNEMNPASFLDVIKGTYRDQTYSFAVPYILSMRVKGGHALSHDQNRWLHLVSCLWRAHTYTPSHLPEYSSDYLNLCSQLS